MLKTYVHDRSNISECLYAISIGISSKGSSVPDPTATSSELEDIIQELEAMMIATTP
jgi:hypothetical protein